MLIAGIVVAAIGAVLFIVRGTQTKKASQIAGTETSRIGELSETAKSVAGEIGAGSFSQFVEIKGKISAENPLVSELAKVQCVHYSMQVKREWEETYWDRDSEGRSVQRTRRGSDIVASNTRSTPFEVNDGSGSIRVDPAGAELITEKAFSQFQPGEAQGTTLRIGSLSFNIGGIALGGGRRTLGYRYEEQVIPVNRDIYILGEATDSAGTLTVQKPSEKGKKFIVSVKSEEEIMKGINTTKTLLLVFAIILIAGGAALVLFNFLR
mgnify:CR=1 FL=1